MDKDKIVNWFTSLHTLTCTFVACVYVMYMCICVHRGQGLASSVFFNHTPPCISRQAFAVEQESADLVHLASQLSEDLLSHLLSTGLRQAVTLTWLLCRSLQFHSKHFAYQASPQALKTVFLKSRNHFLNFLGQDLRKIIKAKVS